MGCARGHCRRDNISGLTRFARDHRCRTAGVRQKLIRLSTELGRLWLKCKDFFCATTKWKIEMDYLHHTSFGIGVLGVLVIVFGVLNGLLKFVRAEFSAARGLLV